MLTVDYDRYAAEEAALGWLNLHANLRLREPASPSCVAGPLLDALDRDLPAIAHLKIFDRCAAGYVKVAITAKGQEPVAEGDLLADSDRDHELVVNLRAPADPVELERIVGPRWGRSRVKWRFGIATPSAPPPRVPAPVFGRADQYGPEISASHCGLHPKSETRRT